MPNNKLIDIKNDNNLQIEHFWIPLKHKSRDERLLELVNIINPYLCIIFCNKKEYELSYTVENKRIGNEVMFFNDTLTVDF